jgi:hypothetical protein
VEQTKKTATLKLQGGGDSAAVRICTFVKSAAALLDESASSRFEPWLHEQRIR